MNNTAKARAEAAFRKVTKPEAAADSETETTCPGDEPASKSGPVETPQGAMENTGPVNTPSAPRPPS